MLTATRRCRRRRRRAMGHEGRRRRIYRSRAARRRRFTRLLGVLAVGSIVLLAGRALGEGVERVAYDRAAAAAYADAWALSANPCYWSSADHDCANFVSQCLAAGGLRPTLSPGLEWHDNGRQFPSVAWVNCEAQWLSLGASGRRLRGHRELDQPPAASLGGGGRCPFGQRRQRRGGVAARDPLRRQEEGRLGLRQPHRCASAPPARCVVPEALLAHPLLPHRGRRGVCRERGVRWPRRGL